MRVSIVLEGMPHEGTSGGSIVMLTVAEHLIALGHEVAVIALLNSWDRELGEEELAQRSAALSALGIHTETLDVPPAEHGSLFWLRRPAESLYPQRLLAPRIRSVLADEAPHVVLGFDTGALLALDGVRPRFGIPGDPRWLSWRQQLRATRWHDRTNRGYAVNATRYAAMGPRLQRLLVDIAAACDAVGMYGAQHASWLRRRGVDCLYLAIPLKDRRPPSPPTRGAGPIRILALGGLQSTATQAGLRLMADDVLPKIERRATARPWQVEIAGGGSLPPKLRRSLERPHVVFRGYVPDSASAIAEADVFLAPADYPVGARTRIIDAFSVGAPIVAHSAAAAGIPELVHDENALLGRNGAEIAAALVAAIDDSELRSRLRRAARSTYERHFTPEIALAPVVAALERIARR